jgi:AcrR family transcriptional regulator
MPSKKPVKKAAGNRQAAYTARNRAALVKAGQEVLAEIGPGATIEQLAAHAQVSPTTIYKYFATKELLFSEAISEMYRGWLIWAYNGAPLGGNLETTLDAGRKLFWVKQSHPLFAKILHNTLRDPSFVIASVKIGAEAVFRNYADLGFLEKKDFDKRFILWSYSYAGILSSVHLTEELSPTQAEESLGIALSIWGISDAKAKKLISRPLVFASVK